MKIGGIKRVNKKILIILCICVLIYANFWNIIGLLEEIMKDKGIHFNFIEKITKLGQENINNGRNTIYAITIRGIKNKILLGHGIDTFDYYTSLEYPHNFCLQFLYDIGIIGSLIVLIPVAIGIKKSFKYCNRDEFIIDVALVVASVPGALFSGNLWKNVILWCVIATFIKRGSINQERGKNENTNTKL